jgi:hypothetical protein
MRLFVQRMRKTRSSSLALLLGALAIAGCATTGTAKAPAVNDAGIRIERVHPTAGGQMLDMRYRVTDAEKAKHALRRGAQVYLLDQASGMKLTVPDMAMVGKLMQHPDQTGDDRIFWILFGNPGGLVKSGGRVTLVIDEIRISDIVVQ